MKRTILTGVMIIGLAVTSAFAATTKESKQGTGSKGKTATTQPASTGSTMAAGTHKRRHHRRHHKAVAQKKATTKSK